MDHLLSYLFPQSGWPSALKNNHTLGTCTSSPELSLSLHALPVEHMSPGSTVASHAPPLLFYSSSLRSEVRFRSPFLSLEIQWGGTWDPEEHCSGESVLCAPHTLLPFHGQKLMLPSSLTVNVAPHCSKPSACVYRRRVVCSGRGGEGLCTLSNKPGW